MQIDIETAQLISQIAKSLGLPQSSEEDLILALTQVGMVEADEEEAQRIWRDAQLPEESTSFKQDEDAITWIHNEILPGIKNYVNGRIQRSTLPYGYPFSDELMQSVYPNLSSMQLQVMSAGWELERWNAIKYLALCEIWKLADTVQEDYRLKGEDFCRLGEKYLNSVIESLGNVSSNVPDNTASGKFGLLVVKLKKNRKYIGNDYSSG